MIDLLRRLQPKPPRLEHFLSQLPQILGFVGQLVSNQHLLPEVYFFSVNFQDCFTTFNIRTANKTFLSKRPGRRRAGSRTSERLVAAITMIPSFPQNHPSQSGVGSKVCSRSSFPPPRPTPRWRPTASISSIKMIAGAAFFASSKENEHDLHQLDKHFYKVRS